MRKEYKKPIIEEEKIELEDIVASSTLDINEVDIVAPRWGNR